MDFESPTGLVRPSRPQGSPGERPLVSFGVMPRRGLAAIVFALAASACGAAEEPVLEPLASASPDAPEPPVVPTPVVLVELFTSEGCPSCPPADAVLARLVERESEGVIALAYHVDYWNEGDHRDPFAMRTATQRQLFYAKSFEQKQLYTPQLVVGGVEELNGSDGPKANRAVEAALARPTDVWMRVAGRLEGPTARVEWEARPLPQATTLHLAVVERRAENRVATGEAAGRTLTHVNVVRSYLSMPSDRRGTARVPVPESARGEDLAVVAFVQAVDRRVVGAAVGPLGR